MKIGKKAPEFSLQDHTGSNVQLRDFAGRWVVLYFYPKDNTPGCTTEAKEFTAQKEAFAQLDAVILGVSPDSVASHCNFIEKQGLAIRLLSDETKEVLKDYGVWGKKKFMGKEYWGVIRSTFLIDPQGLIAQIWSPVTVKGHGAQVLATLSLKNPR